MGPIKILIVDDHTLVRQGLRQICETLGGFEVIGEAQDGNKATAMVAELRPDVILMDIVMPHTDGIQAIQKIMRQNPKTKIIALTMYRQEHYMVNATKAGARGYLLKNIDTEALLSAIEAVARGEYLIDPIVATKVLSELHLDGTYTVDTANVQPLTESEMAILRLVAQGIENEQIAQELVLSVYTVGNRLRSIYSKLHVNNRTQAALYALRHGWATLEDKSTVEQSSMQLLHNY
ncbi:MAG: response regulator transcription factor [Caldilineaceae bacterium]